MPSTLIFFTGHALVPWHLMREAHVEPAFTALNWMTLVHFFRIEGLPIFASGTRAPSEVGLLADRFEVAEPVISAMLADVSHESLVHS